MEKLRHSIKSPRFLVVAGLVVAISLLAMFALQPDKVEASSGLYQVKKGDFLISVVEGGTLQAVNEVMIRNEVEGTARVIYIVPEGSYVKKGDLLVELDSAAAQDQVNLQLINMEKAVFALVQAEEQLAIQKSVVDSEIRAAELKTNFAWMDLDKFIKGAKEQELTKARNEITTIQEKLAIEQEKAKWSEKLEKQGFETKANLDRDMLTVKQTELTYQMSTNTLWMLENFDLPKQQQTFESALREAVEELQRVRHQGARRLAQYEADVKTQKITVDLSRSKLERDQRNLAAAKIYAPQDGLVVYSVSENRFSSESLIEEGATVRNRQILIKLPDVSEMKLTVKIHESHINMVSQGQPAFIVLDSMPDQRFRGYVSKVGLLPDTTSRWGNPNLKVYATEILVTDPMPDIKPGVSARAEIVITNLQNVISVPLQAVTTRQGKPTVFVAEGESSKPVNVQVGLYNTKFIEIVSGLKEGDSILLAPPFDSQQKDLGGAILAEGEAMNETNRVVMTKAPGPRGPSVEGGTVGGENQAGAGDRPRSNRGPSGGSGQRPDFEALRKQFDKNGDGQLDDAEQQAMRESFGGQFGGGRSRRSGTNQMEQGASRESMNPEGGGRRNRGSRQGTNAENGNGRSQVEAVPNE